MAMVFTHGLMGKGKICIIAMQENIKMIKNMDLENSAGQTVENIEYIFKKRDTGHQVNNTAKEYIKELENKNKKAYGKMVKELSGFQTLDIFIL